MVVEDEPAVLQVLQHLLTDEGYLVSTAQNGKEGLEKISDSSGPPNLILADINMPVMDGLKLVSLVKNNQSYKDIPVIIITTEGAKEDKERALAIGANAYLAKPIQTQELIKLVNSFIGS